MPDTDLRALDRRVAEVVMGQEVFYPCDCCPRVRLGGGYSADMPHYSADTDAGWGAMKLVTEAVWQKTQLPFHLDYLLVHFKGEPDWRMGWQARFGMDIHASAFGAPEAVCRAALAALGASDAPA